MSFTELPNHWDVKKLGEVCEFEYGKGLVKANRNETGDVDVFGSNGRVGSHSEYLVEEPCLIVGRKGAAGEVHLSLKPCWPIDTTYFIRKRDCFELKFLYFQLKTLRLASLEKSTAIPGLNRNDAYEKEIVLPPLAEQHRIVAKLEELFSELDAGLASLKTAAQQLKTYRQAVLKWAFEGKLTNDSVPEDELPAGWKWVKLSEVAKISGGLTKNSNREKLGLKLPFLRVANVYFNALNLTDVHTIGLTESEVERVRLEKDDLLFVEGNGSIEQIGRVALWNGAIKNCVHQNHLIKARLSKRVKPAYALHFFCSKIGRDKIKEQANSTSGLHTLSLGKISKLELPLCSPEEQHRIVQEIESRLSVCDKLEETLAASLKQAEALRQSILKQAFAGKLISPILNPDDIPA
ncbi:MAG: restriction endonuclease subunit S [Acidobacteria bacterium]|nr:restriction endonuclease subunit S [Acidobacteriota bacterium]